jgi:hypothetical protein
MQGHEVFLLPQRHAKEVASHQPLVVSEKQKAPTFLSGLRINQLMIILLMQPVA